MSEIRGAEKCLYQLFDLIEDGHLTVINPNGEEFRFGMEGSSPSIRLFIKKYEVYDQILALAALGFCESYMNGWWAEENDNLTDLIGLLFRNNVYKKARGNFSLILNVISQRLQTLPVFIQNSRKNVQRHYDLGNDFYQLFLDESMTYSCGYQLQKTDTLKEMQAQKYELICKKLALQPGEQIIDIGCGWGGMLIHAAEMYGVSGVGITLSLDQEKFATERIRQRGLSDRLKVIVSDYREIKGQYDKFVSIGMFEHVGRNNFSTFMRKTSELLKPGGIGLLHTIGTIGKTRIDPWVDKYIFPGGYLPQLHELIREMRAVNLMVAHCENLKPHYAETLKKWSENFKYNKDKIPALSNKFDDQFIRMWNLYLQSFESGFRYGNLQLFQVLFCKGNQWVFPIPFDFQMALLHE
jgi:cyclopropane-fatty-acyl-phospholipid synthase